MIFQSVSAFEGAYHPKHFHILPSEVIAQVCVYDITDHLLDRTYLISALHALDDLHAVKDSVSDMSPNERDRCL